MELNDTAAIFWAIIPMIVVFIVIFNIFSTSNRARKGLWLLLTGLGLIIVCGLALLYDNYTQNPLIKEKIYYLPFGILILGLLLTGLYLLISGKLNHNHISSSNRLKDNGTGQYLYIVYKYEGMYYIRKERDDTYSGISYKFSPSITYYDDMLEHVIKEEGIVTYNTSLIGTATHYHKKKKTIYYCFIVETENTIGLDGLEKFDPFAIASAKMSETNKKLVMNMLIGQNFNIEI